MIEIRVHLIATNGFPSHNFNSQAFLGNGQSRDDAIEVHFILPALFTNKLNLQLASNCFCIFAKRGYGW